MCRLHISRSSFVNNAGRKRLHHVFTRNLAIMKFIHENFSIDGNNWLLLFCSYLFA